MRLIDLDKIKPMDFPSYEMDGLDVVRYLETLPTVDAVVLPCKLGDPVHIIRECSCYCAEENQKNKRKKCSGKVYLGKRLRTHHCGYVCEAMFDLKHLANFGKTVFLTREEAEAALAERMIHNAKN